MLVLRDALDAAYFGSFLFGLLFSAVSLVAGAGHGGHALPRLGHGHGHGGHHVPGPHGAGTHDGLSPFNLSAILAFVAWFGGVGLLTRQALGAAALVSAVVAVVAGVGAAGLVTRFLGLLVADGRRTLDPADYRLPGTLARVTSSIVSGGTGEIVYEQAGVRQVSAARAVQVDRPILRGTEVVVLRTARGIAMVEPWAEFVGDLPVNREPTPTVDRAPGPAPARGMSDDG